MTDWLTLLPWAITAVAVVLLGIQTVLLRRRLDRQDERLKGGLEIQGRELHALTSGSIGVGRRVQECEKQLHQLQSTIEEMRQNDPLRISYDEASRLVELGADIEDLMNSCGISRPEAELVSALHKRRSAA
ncbi:DUF2802 domain-containing protein [Mangrovitalea sediminis]|uniref:DUF2802 domain-containing protein n=1 Tax=Mangrovitalea sediminis TaxID=1982043 RepID=UPI000BE60026|nr:DUF2802 domain-containing protein [Mangrovitalea sediminis]